MRTPLNLAAVGNAAALLLAGSPVNQTTTLEVKTLLRHLGFEAVQADVSNMLAQVGESVGLYTLEVTENDKTFLVYSVEPIEPIVVPDTSGQFQFRQPVPVVQVAA